MISLGAKTLEDMKIDTSGMEMYPITVLGDYRKNNASGVIDAGTFSAEAMQAIIGGVLNFVNTNYDGWKNPEAGKIPFGAPSCTSCIKKLDDGTVIMGRNMDLPVSFAPALVYRTKGDGKNTYDTVSLAYTSPGSISFDQVAEEGAIPINILSSLMASCTDTVNSEGLYVEVNMRESAECQSESTNPNSDMRVPCLMLCRLIGDHCANIAEALEYVKSLDIYDPLSPGFTWGLSFAMMDKTGRYGVLELFSNNTVWVEGRPGFASGQANFYWSKEANVHHGAGYGRWRKLMDYYYDIESEKDMAEAMQQIWYSNFLTSCSLARDWKAEWLYEANDTAKYPVTENWLNLIYSWRDNYGIKIDEKHLAKVLEIEARQKAEGGPVWSIDYFQDPAHYYDVITVIDLVSKCFGLIPVDARKASGLMESSTISYTANTKEIGFTNRFFEMDDIYHIGLYETTIDRHDTNRKIGDI